MSQFEYLHKYGYEGTTGRFNANTARGNFDNEKYVHTAKNETRSWITPTPTPTNSVTPSITPTITITQSISITPSITPTLSVTPTPTVSTAPPNLTRLSLHISQAVNGLTGYRYSNAEGISENISLGLGSDHTGNYHQVIYPGTAKTAWVKEEDKGTFSGQGHVTGIYSFESIPLSGSNIIIMRGKVAGETLAYASLDSIIATGITNPLIFGAYAGQQRTYHDGVGLRTAMWTAIRSGEAEAAEMATRGYNENTPLGFRTGTVTFLTRGGETSNRASIGFKEGNYADNMTAHELP